MKVLYIAPEHVSGTLSLFQTEHRRRGDECRFVTFWHSRWNYPDDICLHLPLMPDRSWVRVLRKTMQGLRPQQSHAKSTPQWHPGRVERLMFTVRDQLNWPRMAAAITRYDLLEYDIVHLDGGLDFTRDGRFVHAMSRRGAHIAAFYHGSDLRNRGLIPEYDHLIELRLTSEWDLLELDPRLRYLFLPIDTTQMVPRLYQFHAPIRIFHAARNPFKGTEYVERAVRQLKTKFNVELVILRHVPHAEALRIKSESDIVVDQLTNAGGWGYGMNAVEALAMGIPVVTNIPPQMQHRLGDHPFIQADVENIAEVLEQLLCDEERCRRHADLGLHWAKRHHDVRQVGEQLYSYYRELGWIPAT